MKLNVLIAPYFSEDVGNCEVTGLENDSRRIQPGHVFFAYPGAIADGRRFIEAVVQQGAAAVLYDPQGNFNPPSVPVPLIPISGLFQKMGEIAARFYDFPTTQMTVIGITGTNGKTTIAYQLAQAYSLLGRPAAYIGTLGWGEPLQLKPLPNTTPDGLCLQKIFNECLNRGIKHICMEVSSHALAEDRVSGIQFNQAIFTNLTRDHLDYHQTMDAYGAAKARLFAQKGLAVAILNGDDAASHLMKSAIATSSVRQINYGLAASSNEVYASNVTMTQTGTTFSLVTSMQEGPCAIPALGMFNLSNSLAIVSSLMAEGFLFHEITGVLPQLKSAPGRLEMVLTSPVVLVDFAHTPDALENVLKNLRQLVSARIILVFGCGGERDPGKRPIMGRIASEGADVLIVTNDNPRSEDPNKIIAAIMSGVSPNTKSYCIPDRKQAILKALEIATAKDIVIVAGKGHETYQQIGQTKYHFSDQEEILNAAMELGLGSR